MRRAHLDRGLAKASDELRIIEQEVHHHTAELRSNQLCMGPQERQLLDLALFRAGVPRSEKRLELLLRDAQSLTDWYDEKRRRSSDTARNLLLLLIGIFGVFALADYMSLADSNHYRGVARFLTGDTGREIDALFGTLIIVALLAVFTINFHRITRFVRAITRNVQRRWARRRRRAPGNEQTRGPH